MVLISSTVTWAATVTEYDILGRVKRQSVPTEVNSIWEPAGDDQSRGFLWTVQKYDWMGRNAEGSGLHCCNSHNGFTE